MLFEVKRVVSVNNLRAISFIEILVSLSLGLIILFSVGDLLRNISLSDRDYRERIRLQKNTHQLLDYLKLHLFNAGYIGTIRDNSNFPLFKFNGKSYLVEQSCLVLLEDINADGCLGTPSSKKCREGEVSRAKEVNKEIIALKLEGKQLFVLGKNEKFNLCTEIECQRVLRSCSQIKWDKIADSADNSVEHLTFQWVKPDELVKITLELSSVQYPAIRYRAEAYSYLLNGKE